MAVLPNADFARYIAVRIAREVFQKPLFDIKFNLSSQFKKEHLENEVFKFYVDIMPRVDGLLPQFMLTETFIGYTMSRSCLFFPDWPNAQDPVSRQVYQMGYMLQEGPTREPWEKTYGDNGRLTRMIKYFAALMRQDALIGRLLQYLVLQVNFRHHMLSAMILFYLLDVSALQLIKTYPGPMKTILQHIISPNYTGKLNQYFTSKQVESEPQNDPSVLSNGQVENGIKEAEEFVSKLETLCKGLLRSFHSIMRS